jgi:CheY-like chemotaxis protein
MSRVLVVSHDGDLRAVASRVLSQAGWNVIAASHAGHASLACVEGPAFDVLVVEDQMPESSGRLVASRLRRYCPEIRIVRICDGAVCPAGEGIAVRRPFTGDDLIAAVLRAASAIPVA